MTAMDFFINFLRGYASIFDGLVHPRHYQITHGGFAADAKNLRGDFCAVGHNLRSTLGREQADQRQS